MTHTKIAGLTKSAFVADAYIGYIGCMECYVDGKNTYPDNKATYRVKSKSEGGRFVFVADGQCICQGHYHELPEAQL